VIDPDGFRPNVGIVLMHEDGRLFWARRVHRDGWQFPQGGMNTDETPLEAMYRELREETGLLPEHVDVLGVTPGWLRYRLPARAVRRQDRLVCIGQKQVWFLLPCRIRSMTPARRRGGPPCGVIAAAVRADTWAAGDWLDPERRAAVRRADVAPQHDRRYGAPHKPAIPAGVTSQESAMYQFNDQFTKATSQFADVAANANRLAIDNAQKAFGLQMAAFEENTSAAFAFWNELIEVRDVEGFKSVMPKGVQIARTATERSLGTAQEVFANTVKTNEAIGALAKGQFEKATAQATAEVEKVTKAASKK
jgi:8-oxo-dGTP pyrophosphatase MutT (NUDIX family)